MDLPLLFSLCLCVPVSVFVWLRVLYEFHDKLVSFLKCLLHRFRPDPFSPAKNRKMDFDAIFPPTVVHLCLAIYTQDYPTFCRLVKRKETSVNSPDNRGWQPLHWAAWLGDDALPYLKLLLKRSKKFLHRFCQTIV